MNFIYLLTILSGICCMLGVVIGIKDIRNKHIKEKAYIKRFDDDEISCIEAFKNLKLTNSNMKKR